MPKTISDMDLDGYAVGGLAVGESHEEMYHILDVTGADLLTLHEELNLSNT